MFIIFVLPLDYALYEDADYCYISQQRQTVCLKNSCQPIKICSWINEQMQLQYLVVWHIAHAWRVWTTAFW